jgi:demethylmenaquinone methyltransferase/2-methoxy-6-polyprenyl-1,4-benzoquinol methylase
MEQEISHLGARQNYDRLSRYYDSFSGGERCLSQNALELLALQPGENILEIGFGTGHALLEMAHTVGGHGRVEGIDLSPGMLAVANRRVQHAGLAGNISLQLGDATRLPFPEPRFQVAFMSFTLELFPTTEIPLVLAECRRVLAPGGRLGVVSLAKKDTRMVTYYEWFHARYPRLVDCSPIHVRQVLEEAGFTVIQTLEKRLWGLPVEIVVAKKPEGSG